MIKKVLILLIVFGGLVACGTKKPEPKPDYDKVDKAYNDFNRNN